MNGGFRHVGAMRLADLYTPASGLTLVRVLLTAAFPFLPHVVWLPVYALALGTDVADGWLARKYRQQSPAGATFDAWADKALQVNVAWTLVNAGIVPAWWLLLWFVREILQVPMVVSLAHRWRTGIGEPATRPLGRLTTLLLSLTVALLLVGIRSFPLTAAVGALGLAAATDYARLHFAHLRPTEAP